MKVGVEVNSLKFSRRRDPFLGHVHVRCGLCSVLAGAAEQSKIISLPSAFLVRVFSMSCRRARFPKCGDGDVA